MKHKLIKKLLSFGILIDMLLLLCSVFTFAIGILGGTIKESISVNMLIFSVIGIVISWILGYSLSLLVNKVKEWDK